MTQKGPLFVTRIPVSGSDSSGTFLNPRSSGSLLPGFQILFSTEYRDWGYFFWVRTKHTGTVVTFSSDYRDCGYFLPGLWLLFTRGLPGLWLLFTGAVVTFSIRNSFKIKELRKPNSINCLFITQQLKPSGPFVGDF